VVDVSGFGVAADEGAEADAAAVAEGVVGFAEALQVRGEGLLGGFAELDLLGGYGFELFAEVVVAG
jgi:hypothetical protein